MLIKRTYKNKFWLNAFLSNILYITQNILFYILYFYIFYIFSILSDGMDS